MTREIIKEIELEKQLEREEAGIYPEDADAADFDSVMEEDI